MNDIFVYGDLASLVPCQVQAGISSQMELLSYLRQYGQDVEAALLKGEYIVALKVDGEVQPMTDGLVPTGAEIHVAPHVGGEVGAAVAGFIGLTAGTFAFTAAAFIVNFALTYAINALLAPSIDAPDFASDESERSNNIYFNGGVNTENQGAPLPIVYGECRCGSIVIATGLDTEEGPA